MFNEEWEERLRWARDLEQVHESYLSFVAGTLGIPRYQGSGWAGYLRMIEQNLHQPKDQKAHTLETLAKYEGLWRAFEQKVSAELGHHLSATALMELDQEARTRARRAEEAAYTEALKDLGALNG